MDRLRRLIERASDMGGYFSGWLVLLMLALVAIEVFMRYALHRPPMVADEFGAYMLVALAYLGAAYTARQRGHVRITVLVSRLPVRIANWLRVVTLAVGFIFSVILVKSSYDLMFFSFRLHLASPTWLNFPLQGPQMTLAIGFTILSLLLAVEIVKTVIKVKSGENVEERIR